LAASSSTRFSTRWHRALITGGRDLLERSHRQIGLQADEDEIDFGKPESMYLLDDLSISFEIGDRFQEEDEA
jgi:hypothetical protein